MITSEMKKNLNAKNPVVQTMYTSDPAPMVYNDTVYLYTGHDEDASTWYTMNDWRCYSSKDMVNWTDHGSPLSYREFSWSRGDAWAGQCIERNGKFYFYVPINKIGGGMAVGVAISDSPTGPFKDTLGHPLVETGKGDIDPTVFIDDDGQAYLYWGNPYLWYVKLNEDMISFDETVGIVQVPLTEEGFGKRTGNDERATLYEEGPWFYRCNGLYYMIYAASGIPENIAYSTSTNPTGPWTFRGVIMPTQGDSFTSHPGLIDYKGNSYFFYHNGALPGGGGFTRSVCVEQFEYNSDGTFPTINMTIEGVSPVGKLNPYVRNEAETIAWEYGIKTEPCSQGGMNVCSIDDGDYIKVCCVDFGDTGAGTFTASVSSAIYGGIIELHLDSPDGIVIGKLPVSCTGSWDNWKMATTNISGAVGVHNLYFLFKGDGAGNLFKVDHWKFEKKGIAHELSAINVALDRYKIDTVSGMNTANMKVTAIYTDGSNEDITADAEVMLKQEGVVKVSNGIVTGTAYGSASIAVSYGGKTDTLNVNVKNLKDELTVKELVINKSIVSLCIGKTTDFSVIAEYFDGHTEDVTNKAAYNNCHPDIADIENGTITAKAEGITEVSISYSGALGKAVTRKLSISVSSNLNPYFTIEIETMDQLTGGKVEKCAEGGMSIGFIENEGWIMFNKVDFGLGAESFEVRAASGGAGGNIELRLDSPTGPVVGICAIENTGGWQNWVTKSCTVEGASEIHDLYLKFTGGSGYIFNMGNWKFNAIV